MADGYLLDSNICIYLLKGLSPTLIARVRGQAIGTLHMSAISLAEIGLGTRVDPDEARALELMRADITVLPFDDLAADAYAALPFRRARFDRLIGAHALSRGLTVVTNDVDGFRDIPGVMIENWTQ